MELDPEATGRCLQLLRFGFEKRIGWVDEQSHDACRGDQLVQQLQPFWRHFHVRLGHTRDIAARPAKTGDDVELHGIADGGEDNRNSGRRCLCRERRRSGGCGDDGHLTIYQIGRQRRQPLTSILAPTVFDRHVLALDITGLS